VRLLIEGNEETTGSRADAVVGSLADAVAWLGKGSG
jgi:hypothetical protein